MTQITSDHPSKFTQDKFAQANPSPVLSSAGDGTLQFVNPAALKLMHDLALEQVEDLLPVSHKGLVRACLKTGVTLTEKCQMSDRNIVWMYKSADESDVVYVYGHDISAYQAETPSSTGLPEANPNPVLVYDLDGEVQFKNRAVSRLVKALKLANIEGILPVNHKKLVETCIKTKMPAAGDRYSGEHSIVWSYQLSAKGTTIQIYGYDVTNQHPENFSNNSFPEINPSPVITSDPYGELRYTNSATSLLLLDLGLDNIKDLLPDEHKGLIKACHSTNTPLTKQHQAGEKILSWSYHPVAGSDVIYIYGHDITDCHSSVSGEQD